MPAPSTSYQERRGQLLTYFDRTAAATWSRLTTNLPVDRVRETVRAGRDQMRALLLSYLPADLTGKRLFDAGCGTGLLAVEAARRGAEVVAVDLAPTLIEVARERQPGDLAGSIDFRAGDMFDPALGEFDYVVAMDSLIHYQAPDIVQVLAGFAARTRASVVFTFAPRTPALALMHAAGKLFPRSNRSPAIEPVSESRLRRLIAAESALAGWQPVATQRVVHGFYTSQAMELRRS